MANPATATINPTRMCETDLADKASAPLAAVGVAALDDDDDDCDDLLVVNEALVVETDSVVATEMVLDGGLASVDRSERMDSEATDAEETIAAEEAE